MKGKITGSSIVDEKLAKIGRRTYHKEEKERIVSIVSPIVISDDNLIKELNRICKECNIEIEDFLEWAIEKYESR
ncbi:MAG: hypothetical protein ABIL18_08685 [candidate division WOR-3 bacterium]